MSHSQLRVNNTLLLRQVTPQDFHATLVVAPQSSVRDQAEIEKYGTNSTLPKLPEDNRDEYTPHRGLLSIKTTNPSKRTRQKWNRDEYKKGGIL